LIREKIPVHTITSVFTHHEKSKGEARAFFKSHKEQIPLEVIIGPDTRIVKVAREYEDQIEEEHFEKL